MNALLEQFVSESRESLQGIGEKLMQLEKEPASTVLMTELFRFVHTLKGNSGLFDLPELTRVLHAGEDLMDAVRNGEVAYSPLLADRLLDAMDFVGLLCDEIETNGVSDAGHAKNSVRLAEELRQLIVVVIQPSEGAVCVAAVKLPISQLPQPPQPGDNPASRLPLADLPEEIRMTAYRATVEGGTLNWIEYIPIEECFFQGDDPFFQARQTPGILWGGIAARRPWPELVELDPYCCILNFSVLSTASPEELQEYYRYVPDQVRIIPVPGRFLMPQGDANGVPIYQDFVSDELGAQEKVSANPGPEQVKLPPEVATLLCAQREILSMPDDVSWLTGRIKSVAASLSGCLQAIGASEGMASLEVALEEALELGASAPLLHWLNSQFAETLTSDNPNLVAQAKTAAPQPADSGVKYGRRAEDTYVGPKSIKVEQAKIDRLMNLIGEMIVAKNALPYLAGRAETVFGVRDLSREIKSQYAVINRIAEEMQDSIMQVRMMPVSFVFQRFPRLVRDTSNKLAKEVNLILEGEDTEADKNVIEALGDPLVHIVRNSLDHGIEMPDVRRGLGKPAAGTITIRATQEADRVIIEIKDDGKGIDPDVIKRLAYEKGLIDTERLERLTDQEAVNLVFAAGFSTAEVVSDLSGRGVGMDVVKTAIEKVNGSIHLESEKGKGTRITLALPLSMAVTNIMIVESNNQLFGVPMGSVVETVRIARADIRTIKNRQVTVLRGRIVPLKSLNSLLSQHIPQKANAEDELAVLVVSLGGELLGIMVDAFHETVDIILKPMTGVLAGLSVYSGSALLGDGSVLMVLNIKEIL